jgi:hypothetical protein
MRLRAETIDHNSQRYDTCGDYEDVEGVIEFRVSKMARPEYEWFVLIHEIVEKFLCDMQGVKNKDIDQFDIEFERKRKKGNVDEPGDALGCPYGRQHTIATAVERMLCGYLGIPWGVYDKEVLSLEWKPKRGKKVRK